MALDNPFDFSGKSIILTGAAGGLGRPISIAFAGAGAHVALCDRNEKGLSDLAHEIKDNEGEVIAESVELCSQKEVQGFVDLVLDKFKKIDVLVNLVGGIIRRPSIEYDMQDWEQIMLNDAPQVFSSDPQKNIVFSVHMYQVYSSYTTINDYMSTFVNQLKLPLVVGEFGADHQGEDVDEEAIMELAEKYGVGYLGWSWSGNSSETESLDITIDFDVNNLSSWGETLIDGTHGIRSTAEPATVFMDDSIDTDTDTHTITDDDAQFPGCGTVNPGCGG